MENKPNILMLWELIKPPNGLMVVDENGKVLPPSSQVFKDVSNSMISTYPKMTPKNIYTIILSRRYNVYDKLVEGLGVSKSDLSWNSDKLNSTGDTSLSGLIVFTIEVTDLWPKIQPESVTYKFQDGRKRDMYVLRRDAWTSILYEKIFEATKIPCAISFRNAKISKAGIFATVNGKCPECGCVFVGRVANEPEPNETIAMECEIRGFDPTTKHAQKRHLKGEARLVVAKELVEGNKLACQWRRQEADKKMLRVGEKEPPHLYSDMVLRKAKQEMQDRVLDVKSTDVFESLHLMMYGQKYNGAIKRISMNPLQVMYYTKDQELIYDKYHNSVCIDGTGSLVKKIKLPNGELCPHIYLYQMVTKVGNKTAPVCQMISSAHGTDDIFMWLRVFLKSVNFRVPKECVCDFDKALLGAVAQAFGQFPSLKHYLAVCFDLLMADTEALPPCFIRLDVCHFTNMIARWKCFEDKHKLVRTFYLRAMAILRKQETVEKFTEIAKAILTLALDHDGKPNGHAEQARDFLVTEIRSLPSSFEEEEGEENDDKSAKVCRNDPEDLEIHLKDNKSWNFQKWVEELYRGILERIEVDKDSMAVAINGYHCPKLAKKLKNLLVYFPIFSEVMRGPFKYGSINATSAAVESEFNDLKNRTLKHAASTLRVDKFVATHLLSLPGKLKLVLADTDIDNDYVMKIKPNTGAENKSDSLINPPIEHNSTDVVNDDISLKREEKKTNWEQDSEDTKNNIVDIEEMRAEHNWRNKNESRAKPFRYADPCPLFSATTKFPTELPTIPNGNICPLVRNKGCSISITNTCAFDSLCQILAFAVSGSEVYKSLIQDSTSPIFACVFELLGKGLSKKFYSTRAEILVNTPQLNTDVRRNNILKLAATANIGDMATWMLKDDPSCVRTKRCAICEVETVKRSIIMAVDFDKWTRNGALGLADALNQGDRPRPCCGHPPACIVRYGSHLIIETDIAGNQEDALQDFEDSLTLAQCDEAFQLAGIVAYKGPYSQKSVGHYVAFIRTGSSWFSCDDTKPKAKPRNVDGKTKVSAHLCVYIRERLTT